MKLIYFMRCFIEFLNHSFIYFIIFLWLLQPTIYINKWCVERNQQNIDGIFENIVLLQNGISRQVIYSESKNLMLPCHVNYTIVIDSINLISAIKIYILCLFKIYHLNHSIVLYGICILWSFDLGRRFNLIWFYLIYIGCLLNSINMSETCIVWIFFSFNVTLIATNLHTSFM